MSSRLTTVLTYWRTALAMLRHMVELPARTTLLEGIQEFAHIEDLATAEYSGWHCMLPELDLHDAQVTFFGATIVSKIWIHLLNTLIKQPQVVCKLICSFRKGGTDGDVTRK